MREILFRGKCVDNGEWVYGYYYKAKYYRTDEELCDYITVPHPDKENAPSDHFMVEEKTVGQCTGLKDKNDKRIFEGDIIAGAVQWQNEKKNGYVDFRDGSFGLIWQRGNIEHFYPFTSMCNIEYEVIGDIYDNPELLEAE